MINTTYFDVKNRFESMPMSKYILNQDLIYEWFLDSLGEYELEINKLDYDYDLKSFNEKLPSYTVKTLALIMYTNYLTRELSRAEKLNGFYTEEVKMTGTDATKRVTMADLQLELSRVQYLLHKQKKSSYS